MTFSRLAPHFYSTPAGDNSMSFEDLQKITARDSKEEIFQSISESLTRFKTISFFSKNYLLDTAYLRSLFVGNTFTLNSDDHPNLYGTIITPNGNIEIIKE